MSESKEILISAIAIAKILAIDSLDTSKESAGILIGYIDENSDTMVITDVDTGKQHQTSTYVVMDDEALVQIISNLQERDNNETILGWIHTHPGYGCFLSGTDKGTQRTYQNLFDRAVAMVVDPLKYYDSLQQVDLDIQFFRMINDFDYKPLSFNIYFDDVTRHLSNIVDVQLKWEIPKLPADEVKKLHEKLESIQSPSLISTDKKMLHGFVDILSEATDEGSTSGENKKVLNEIDNKLMNITQSIDRIYEEETHNVYAILNIFAAIIIVISWFLIVRFM